MLAIDDLDTMQRLDTGRMLHFLEQLPEVGRAAYERGRHARLPLQHPDEILIVGMGGSGISGDLIRTQLLDSCDKPVVVHRGDRLPRFADGRTLAVFMSYSGNTGETLGCLREAIARGVPSIVVTGGGMAGELAKDAGYPVVEMPAGWQPRAALGDLFFALLGITSQVSACDEPDVDSVVARMRMLREAFSVSVPTDRNPAKTLAQAIHGRIPLIVGTVPTTECVALRWKCQFNENAKLTTLLTLLPEMTHNDIVNLSAHSHKDYVVILHTDPSDSDFVQRQRKIAMEIIAPNVSEILEIKGEGETLLERQMSAIYLGDWVSVYLAFLAGVDPTPVDAISRLKERMASQGARA